MWLVGKSTPLEIVHSESIYRHCLKTSSQKARKLNAQSPLAIRSSNQGSDLVGLDIKGKFALTYLLEVKCLWDSTIIPNRFTKGSASYDISATCSYIIPTKDKGVV